MLFPEWKANPNYEKNAVFLRQLQTALMVVALCVVAFLTAGAVSAILGSVLGSGGAYLTATASAYVTNQVRTGATGEFARAISGDTTFPVITAVNFIAPTTAPEEPLVEPEAVTPKSTTPGLVTDVGAMMAGIDLSVIKKMAPAVATLMVFGFIFSNVGAKTVFK
jgi:hypothetical protein